MGDIFSAISIILVFATVSLDIFAKESDNFITKQNPDKDKPTEQTDLKKEKNKLLFKLIVFWLLIPKSIEIIKDSEISLWNFDIVKTFYVIINFGILIFIVLTTNYIYKILNKNSV